ncbi:MAG: MmcQ/YjbR family DNA-binding protein [Actinomycetota bacterium]
MASWDDVRRIAMKLPETGERSSGGLSQWRVRGKLFVWMRPLRAADYAALGESAPDGPIMGVRTADAGVKEALVADAPEVYFTTPHFDGYPAVLVQLDTISLPELEELIVEAWSVQAPKRLAKEYLAGLG